MTGAEINPRKVKTFVNDLNLQWAMLVNSGQAAGVDRVDFNSWQVLARIAPRNFLDQIRERLDDLDLRFKFVMDAIKWAGGEDGLKATFQEYDTWRLRRVLRDLEFSPGFNAQILDAFVHLTAPLQEFVSLAEKAEAKPVEVEPGLTEVVPEAVKRKETRLRGVPAEQKKAMQDALEYPQKGATASENRLEIGGLQFIKIPAGKFLMGSKDDNSLAYDGERPQHTLDLPAFWMAQFPLTNAQYAQFVSEGKHPVDDWSEKKNHPVVNVSWNDAIAYCKWFNEQNKIELQEHGLTLHLPTEAQWEKAARGEYGNEWPWGNEFDQNRCNSDEGGKNGTTPVDAYPSGASPYGVLDMVGNVWEWTHTSWKDYPYKADDGRESEKESGSRVLRGGSFDDVHRLVRCAYRSDYDPDLRCYDLGFRVCVSPIS